MERRRIEPRPERQQRPRRRQPERIRLRRQCRDISAEQDRFVQSMRALQFSSDDAGLNVETVHIFPEGDDGFALSFVTTVGTINCWLPNRLAAELSDGFAELVRTRRRVAHRT